MTGFKVLVLLSVFAIAMSLVESSPLEVVTEIQEGSSYQSALGNTYSSEVVTEILEASSYQSAFGNTYSSELSLPTETEVGEQTEELSRQKRSCYTAQVRTRSGRIISVRRCNG
ncbi:uncharacterized protein LOC119670505 isoform X1 [Teleopsis dalmanni]|uniref:uncharacterized protein LOC119670505 isoform X1 n=1 Tax=Teleopsis dalmanni TaxID=139649 RepID=UPI0018CDF4C9|nr:uncharacterized protein LOC119670505 isoform X1 [Teleopsis dalmanni]